MKILIPESTLDIDKKIDMLLDSFRGIVKTFLKDPDPPTWIPPESVTSSNRKFLNDLQIPSYPNGAPSILFHKLDEHDDKEIEMIFGPGDRQYVIINRALNTSHSTRISMFICNTSGSGKTRRMLEGFTKYWGFYFVASPVVKGVGILDFRIALDDVAQYPEWVSDLELVEDGKRAAQNELNSRIASKHLRKVLAARVVVFELFLQLAIEVHGTLQEKHKLIWLLFQLSDEFIPGYPHPFVRILRCLIGASSQAVDTLVQRLDVIRHKYLSQQHFIVGLDQAEWASRNYPRPFTLSHTLDIFPSIIGKVVEVFSELPMKLVVSGTVLSLEEFENSTASGVPKDADGVQVFHELGMFDTWPKLESFLKRYVPASILDSSSGSRLQQRMRVYLQGRCVILLFKQSRLTGGRYLFSVSFVEHLLRNGLQSPHKLLNEFIKGHSTCLPDDTGEPFTLDEPDLQISVRIRGFEWEALKYGTSLSFRFLPPRYGVD